MCENTWRPNGVSNSQVVGTVGNNKKQGVKIYGAQFGESKNIKICTGKSKIKFKVTYIGIIRNPFLPGCQ